MIRGTYDKIQIRSAIEEKEGVCFQMVEIGRLDTFFKEKKACPNKNDVQKRMSPKNGVQKNDVKMMPKRRPFGRGGGIRRVPFSNTYLSTYILPYKSYLLLLLKL